MVLVASVVKKSVKRVMDKLWNITINLVLTEDGVEVIDKDYSVRYRTGDSIPTKQARFIAMMQGDIDEYKGEQVIFDAAAFNTVVTNIENALVV